MKSKRYPNLYRRPNSPYWVFRKYSAAKRKQFSGSTEEELEDRAYKVGLELFNEWMMDVMPSGRAVLIRDLSRSILAATEARRPKTFLAKKYQHDNHINPSFGHLRPNQITETVWSNYQTQERRKGKRTKLRNTRACLKEILLRAKADGMIKNIPTLALQDAPPAPPRYLDEKAVKKILVECSPLTRLLCLFVWKMGARPGEVLQYRWDMIDSNWVIHIPGQITKTGRSREIPINSELIEELRKSERVSDFLFPSPHDPNKPMGDYSSGWENACARANVDATIYNLRDTFITNALKRGISSVFVGKYCDTSGTMIDRKYAVAEPSILKEIAG